MIVQHLVNEHHWGPKLRNARVFESWAEIAGKDVAQYSHPVRLQGGVLVVAVTRSDWATSLKYMEPQLVANVNNYLGESLVSRIRVYVER